MRETMRKAMTTTLPTTKGTVLTTMILTMPTSANMIHGNGNGPDQYEHADNHGDETGEHLTSMATSTLASWFHVDWPAKQRQATGGQATIFRRLSTTTWLASAPRFMRCPPLANGSEGNGIQTHRLSLRTCSSTVAHLPSPEASPYLGKSPRLSSSPRAQAEDDIDEHADGTHDDDYAGHGGCERRPSPTVGTRSWRGRPRRGVAQVAQHMETAAAGEGRNAAEAAARRGLRALCPAESGREADEP